MARDCKKFSPKAQEIFNKLEQHFPPDPWKNSQWNGKGTLRDNGIYDLRKSADRMRLESDNKAFVGYWVALEAIRHIKEQGTLDAFTQVEVAGAFKKSVEILVILNELDFQIETMDIVEGAE